MTQNIEQEIVSLKAMTATELRVRYAEVFDGPQTANQGEGSETN